MPDNTPKSANPEPGTVSPLSAHAPETVNPLHRAQTPTSILGRDRKGAAVRNSTGVADILMRNLFLRNLAPTSAPVTNPIESRDRKGAIRNAPASARILKRTLLVLALAVAAIAQTSSQIESDDVKRVGVHLKCTCGCSENLNCSMSSGQCHICKPARAKIFKMQQSGMNDDSIIASFVKSGEFTLLSDPSSYFWVVPYFSLALGGVVVWFVLRRLRGGNKLTPATAAGPAIDNDPDYARYRDAIEKDTEKLD